MKTPIKGKDGTYLIVDEMPMFKGCDPNLPYLERKLCADEKMLKFVYDHIKYPKEAKQNKIEGTVVVRFIIDEHGQLQNPSFIKEVGAGCEQAVLKVVNLMRGNWEAGKHAGKPVAVQFNLPVKFRL